MDSHGANRSDAQSFRSSRAIPRHLSNTTAQIDDYYLTERQIAEANAATIFPGLDASAAIDLWQAAYPHRERHAVRFHHFAQIRAAAHDAATAIGKPRDYFTSTAYFRRQRRAMIMNFVYPYTPGIVWNMLGKVRGRRSPTA